MVVPGLGQVAEDFRLVDGLDHGFAVAMATEYQADGARLLLLGKFQVGDTIGHGHLVV